MNYAGKFDAKLSAEGLGLHSHDHAHVETVHANHVPADAIIVPDAHLLFNGEFKRSGVDLILSGDDRALVLHDYFKGEKRAALSSPDGAHLTGDIVNALVGHVDYAQAGGSASASQVIGHVTKLVGNATAIRNGVSVILNNGDNVEKGDVVQSGSDSTVGITFIDGTVFGLSSNARMVLNEMVYDPNGSNNSSLLSLVAGTITFVAGETAKHGDMKVDTPVATMGIRGTAVLVEIDFTVPGQGSVPDAKFQVLVEPDGTTGSYILFDKTTLTPLAVVDKAGQQINISNGILSQTTNPLSPEVQKLITDVFSLKFSDNSNPNTNTHFTDSIVPQPLAPIKLASGATATPFILNVNNSQFNSPSQGPNGAPVVIPHIAQPPQVVASGNSLTVHTGTAKSSGVDTASGAIHFTDINAGDRPTVATHFVSLKLLDAQHNDITATLTSQQLAAVEAQLVVTPSPANNNNGTATWTYSVADSVFNFLTAGETLTLTYDAVVNNNFLPFEQQADAQFTITINGPSVVEWIHPTGDLWSVGSNWNSGTVPTATDDVIIPAEHILGGSGLYDVTIETQAFARTLTLNANNTTGGQVINHSTLTIGETLTIFNNGVLSNSGTVVVGGQMELLNQSSLLNSGLITLGQGGDFKDQSSVSNAEAGTIELAGGTLDLEVTIANSGGTLQIDNGATLKLNGATINGGTINDNGTIDVTADSSINGTSTDNGEDGAATVDALLNNGGVTVESDVTLTLDNVTVTGTTFADTASGATIQVDIDTTLTLDDVMVTGGTINDNGTIDVTADSSINGTSIDNGEDGTTTVDALLNNGGVTIESDVTLTLDNVTVTGTTFTDTAGGATIQVDGGTTLTLDDVTVIGGAIADDGTIDISGTVTLENGVTVNGGVLSIASGATLDIENSVTGTGATLNGVDVLNSGTIQVDAGSGGTTTVALVLDGGTTVTGGTLLIHVPDSSFEGVVEIATGGATFDDVTVENNNILTIDSSATLTLDDNTTISGGTITDNGTIHITGPAKVSSANLNIAASGFLLVGSNEILKLDGVAVTGGTITDNGTIDVLGSSSINGTTAGEATTNAILDSGGVTVESGVTLTLDNVTVNGTIFTDIATGSTIKVDSGDTLAFNGATINGGTLKVLGEIDSSGISFITGATIVNANNIVIVSGTLTIDPTSVTNTGTIEVKGDSTLVLSDDIVTNDGGTIQVDAIPSHTATLDLEGSTINGGTLTISGLLDATGTNGLHGMAITNALGATLESTGGVLTIDGSNATFNNAGPAGGQWRRARPHQRYPDQHRHAAGNQFERTGADLHHGDQHRRHGDGRRRLDAGPGRRRQHQRRHARQFRDSRRDRDQRPARHGDHQCPGCHARIDRRGSDDRWQQHHIQQCGPAGGQWRRARPHQRYPDQHRHAAGNRFDVLELTSTTVTNTGGTVTVDAGSTLDLDGGDSISGGTLGNSGTLDATGTNGLHGMAITNALGATLESTGGVLTIDGSNTTFNNAGLLEANGGGLDLTNDTLTNTGTLQATNSSVLELTSTTVINTNGTVEATGTNGVLDLQDATISGGTVTTTGSTDVIEATSGISTISDTSSFVNNGTLETLGAELDLVNTTVTNNGSIIVDLTEGLSGTLNLKGATINGGKVSTAASTDVIEATSGVSTISGTTSFVNAGTVEANGAELDLVNTTVTNTNGTVEIDRDWHSQS